MERIPLMQPPRVEDGKIVRDEIKFSDIFSSAEPGSCVGNIWPETAPGIGSYCNVTAGGGARNCYESLCVRPTERTIALIREHMLKIDNDRIYFQVITFGDEAHVHAKYNQILGSRFLAVVPTSSIPLKEIT